MEAKITYQYSAVIWKHNGPAAWYFTSLPTEISKEIRKNLKWQEEGWGRMKVVAQIGNHTWKTAIWYDCKKSTYILPIKAVIRKKEKILLDQKVQIQIWI